MPYDSDIGKVTTLLERDRRNLTILRDDADLNRPVLPVCDCADILTFLHMTDPEQEANDAYAEGVRRCFVDADKVILVPPWVYEVLGYMHKVIIDNIEAFGHPGGYELFLKKYPQAHRFGELWSQCRFDEAQELYADRETWVQILALTNDQHVTDLVGATIQRFNHLCNKHKLVSISDFVDLPKSATIDEVTYTEAMDCLEDLRPTRKERLKNEIDARSLAIVRWSSEQCKDQFFTAVTLARKPLEAFYRAIDETHKSRQEPLPYNLARSSISRWINDLVKRRAGKQGRAFLQRGIELLDDILARLPALRKTRAESRETDGLYPSRQLLDALTDESVAKGLLEAYTGYYRDHIFRPIEERGGRPSEHIALTLEGAAAVLDAKVFEDSMRRARKALHYEAQEMLVLAKPHIDPGRNLMLGGRRLVDLFGDIRRDFERNVF